MTALHCWLQLISWTSLLAFAQEAVGAVTNFDTGIAEFAPIFPRNETYAPSSVLPFVFLSKTRPSLGQWWNESTSDWDVAGKQPMYMIEEELPDAPDDEPFIAHYAFGGVFDTEGYWSGSWSVTWGSCTQEEDRPVEHNPNGTTGGVHFTTKEGGQDPHDFTEGPCSESEGLTWNITEVATSRSGTDVYCAWVSSTKPEARPCEAQVESETMESIFSSATEAYCGRVYGLECPEEDEDEDGGAATRGSFAAAWTACVACFYKVGQLDKSVSELDAASIRSLSKQMRRYLESGFGPANETGILFAQSGQTSLGLYLGSGLQREGTGSAALAAFESSLSSEMMASSIALQWCSPDKDDAIKTWYNASCLDIPDAEAIPGKAYLVTPLLGEPVRNETLGTSFKRSEPRRLAARGECETIEVNQGNGCPELAPRCGISGDDFTKYNDYDDDLCSTLQRGQHVCCTSGDLPDFSPDPNPDGSCSTHRVGPEDTCSSLAAANSLDAEDIKDFNKNTWGWSECDPLYRGTLICLSPGDPSMPATRPTDGTKISDLNPCPLNACCNTWGFCGITEEYCTDTSTGAPGTAKEGTNGCISNCGNDIIKSDAPAEFRKIGYFQGYNLKRARVLQDATQIDGAACTHLQFAFGMITHDYEINAGDLYSQYEFCVWKSIQGPKKIVSFGGWAFSAEPTTHTIFREGTKPANRLTLATNIANFVKEHDLDGAPDIPGIPPGAEDEGLNYLKFLVVLKNLLPGKEVSIAAPSSFWYLKQYPIDRIAEVVCRLHCLHDVRSPRQVNVTETHDALSMITKAGVPSNKVAAGITSYGRSYNMADGDCYTAECYFTGTRLSSDATLGPCTGESGILANAEILDIIDDPSRVNHNFVDADTHSNVLVYDGNQYVSWMSEDVKSQRQTFYQALGIGGSVNWAMDLEKRRDPPVGSSNWAIFKSLVRDGKDPDVRGDRNGNWTELKCDDLAWDDLTNLSPEERWHQMDAPTAWADLVTVWKENKDGAYEGLSNAIGLNMGLDYEFDCATMRKNDGCSGQITCVSDDLGPGQGVAGLAILQSFVAINGMFRTVDDAITDSASLFINNALVSFADDFAPEPPEVDNTWTLVLLDILTIGASAVLGPVFKNIIAGLPRFAKAGSTAAANIEDTSILAVQQGTTLAKDLLSTPPSEWDQENQDDFKAYITTALGSWSTIVIQSLAKLFDGSDESIERLGDMIADGTFISGGGRLGSSWGYSDESLATESDVQVLRKSITRNFFAMAIPEIWRMSGTFGFVVDTGVDCDDDFSDLKDKVLEKTKVCHNGKQYYLADPSGDASWGDDKYSFSVPPGVDSLGEDSRYGSLTVEDIVIGSLNTYEANGGNGAPRPKELGENEINKLAFTDDVRASGLMRLPVCSPERAWRAWYYGDTSDGDHYPCHVLKGRDYCSKSTFKNQGSNASPPVEDCRQIIKNLEGLPEKDWRVDILGGQTQLAKSGECAFGAEARHSPDGNIWFRVGSQDIIDLINDSINKFGDSGRVGAKGDMDCDGNAPQVEQVEWGIY
ncbi:glycoside hydrolase [Emericellopsis atlantica]|uniref:chitinase n=1 Tax=Emericellopsis atlantica TaxID=2614577 RepID=A0A9P7ZQW9_9HYPO|nr:glycoside hydrolase [Emericellopsis atlantica]KAG9256684.1 glycoside hydrolase [Emericellopsis atlantica]